MSEYDFLLSRHSIPALQLGHPGPDVGQLDALLSLAIRVPDHGRLAPWRLLLLEGEARRELGRQLAEIHVHKVPGLPESKQIKDRQRYAHAPLVIVVIAQLEPGHAKVPEQEQLLSAGCVAYNLLLGAQALGFAAQWLTSWAAYDTDAAALLGLVDNERVIGFVHIGAPKTTTSERERPSLASKVSRWRS